MHKSAIVLVLALTAVSTAADAANIKIGFITKFPAGFYTEMMNAAKNYAEKNNVDIILGQSKTATDTEGEISIIESMIAQGVNGLAIAPVDVGVKPALDKAVAAGIKVVLVDNDIPDWTSKSSFVGTNNFNGGVIAGKYLATRLKDGDEIAVLAGVPGVPALDDRVNGMLNGLRGVKVKVVSTLGTNCTRELGASAAEDILTAHPNIVGIYAACAPPLMGAIQSIDNAGIDPAKLILVGFDALPEEITEIQKGREQATVAQFPTKIGELGTATLINAIRGETVSKNVDSGEGLVTKENVAQFK